MYWLLGRNFDLSNHNKIILYTPFIRPIWSYGMQLSDWTSDSYQSKVLIFIINAPWYVRNSDHRDHEIKTVIDIIVKFANPREKRLQNHINIEASRLLNLTTQTEETV
jgi:hypothetical protein